jgi:hypothetical protein
MTNCWSILEIEPTHNIEEISKARRSLVRKWHPDTTGDSSQKDTYTVRCAEINAAFDEAVRLAEIRERALRFDPAELRRSSRHSFRSEGRLKIASPLLGLLFATYFLTFRLSFPATIVIIVLASGAVFAAVLDWFAYRYAVKPALRVVEIEKHPFLPWAILEMINVAAVGIVFPDSSLLFQSGILLAIPIWRGWRWARGRRHTTAYAN